MRSERPLETKTGGRAATTGVIPGDVALSVGNPRSTLPAGWKWRLLTDVARLETGHTPSRRHPEYWGGAVPWIGIRDATGNHGRTIFETAQYTNELGIRNSSARILPANTVCLSRTASVGYVVVMGVPMATSQDFVNWVCGPQLDHRYLKYVLLAERQAFLRFASGTTHQTIYFPEVKAFHVATPPLQIQRGIAGILGALDVRIELLRQTNVTLESIAQALFKSWFIDFDPVRAKADGREPEGVDAAAAALFPAEFAESALGLIPKGWVVTKLGDYLELTKGCSYKGEGLSEGDGAHMFNLGCFNAHRVFANEKVKRYIGEYRPRHAVVPGDLIMANTDMTQARDILGRPAFVPEDFEPGFISHHVFKVTMKTGDDDLASALRLFLFFALQQDAFRERAIGFATGTTVLALPATTVTEYLSCMPPDNTLLAFAGAVRPLLERIRLNEKHADTLADVRDELLPRLISGKLRVSGAQAIVQDATA